MTTMPHWLSKQAFLQPEYPAVDFPDGSCITFAELEERCKRKAAALFFHGVKEKDHIAILSSNRVSFIESIFALSYLGARAVLLNTRLTIRELDYQIHDGDVKAIIYEAAQEEKVEALTAGDVSPLPFHTLTGDYTMPEMKERIDLEDVFTLMYTSGTTGAPKAVLHTYGNHWHSAVSSALNLGMERGDKWILNLPMFHVSGFSTLMKGVIYGMTIEHHARFDAQEVVESIKQRGATMVSGVSVMLEELVEVFDRDDIPGSFRCFLLGGGPATEKLLNRAASLGIPVFQTYGMTETTSQIATLAPADATRKLGSAGKALATASLHINAAEGEIGEILVAGPMVSGGYYKRDREEGLLFATGDMGYFDEEGFLYLAGRKKEMIISGGENIYPAEIENVLVQVPGVSGAAVTGMKDEKWGEVPAVFLTGKDIKRDKILQYCERHLARYKHPAYVYRVAELPRNASNKVLKYKLTEMVKAGECDEIE